MCIWPMNIILFQYLVDGYPLPISMDDTSGIQNFKLKYCSSLRGPFFPPSLRAADTESGSTLTIDTIWSPLSLSRSLNA